LNIYQNEWASIARMLIALQRDLRTTLFPREVGVVDSFMLEALLLRLYLWQLEGTPATVSRAKDKYPFQLGRLGTVPASTSRSERLRAFLPLADQSAVALVISESRGTQ
jgi:hypothetical protein